MRRKGPRCERVFKNAGRHNVPVRSGRGGRRNTCVCKQTMDVAYISAFSALAGSIIGGLTSGFTTWLNQRAQARVGLLVYKLSHREDLYRDFIVAASKAYGEANMSNAPQIQELIALYGMVSRMRVQSAPQTVACAEAVVRATIDAYHAPNRTVADLHAALQSGDGMVDPLREFAEAAREELGRLRYP
jgi:hypothetical protein